METKLLIKYIKHIEMINNTFNSESTNLNFIIEGKKKYVKIDISLSSSEFNNVETLIKEIDCIKFNIEEPKEISYFDDFGDLDHTEKSEFFSIEFIFDKIED